MADTKSIRDRFGIDYLLREKEAEAPSPLPSSTRSFESTEQIDKFKQMDQMVRVLEQLRTAPNQELPLHELVNLTGLDLPALLKVTDALAVNQLIVVTTQDRFGNHKIQMTAKGQELLGSLNR